MNKIVGQIAKNWQNGFWGKVAVTVTALGILAIAGSAIAIPVMYQTKAEAKEQRLELEDLIKGRTVECLQKIERVESRNCESIGKNEARIEALQGELKTELKELRTELISMNRTLGKINGKLEK